MILPEYIHRHWNVVEPAMLAGISAAGGTLTLLLVPEANSPAQYGAIFIGFLLFLGMGVIGIVGFSASYIVKAVIKGMADIGGQNAEKVFHLHTQEQFDQRFREVEEASSQRADKFLEALGKITSNLSGLEQSVSLLNQELKHQVSRGDELRKAIQQDIESLQSAVFTGRRPT